jgi:ATP-dependent RNA helicase DeaD
MPMKSERLSEALSLNLAQQGFDHLTEVQSAVLAADSARSDLHVIAPTGSGKTIAFGLAVARALHSGSGHGAENRSALVVLPTRELAGQVARVLERLYRGSGLSVVPVLGDGAPGAALAPDRTGRAVFVATPGRLRERLAENAGSFADCACVVFDEADELLSGDYDGDLAPILGRARQEEWRVHLFTATSTSALEDRAARLLAHPLRIEIPSGAASLPNVEIEGIVCTPAERDRTIGTLLRLHHPERAIVFANRRDEAARLSAKLHRRGFSVVNLTGALPSQQREGAMDRLKRGHARVCVATDVAARGLDIDGLQVVVHSGVPETAESLLHRCGRAGRGPVRGRAVLVVCPDEKARAERLARLLGRKIRWIAHPTLACIREADRRRVLGDRIFEEEPAEEDRTLAQILAERFSLEALSVACARLWRRAQPMARDLEQQRSTAFPAGGAEWLAIATGALTRSDMAEILRLICATAGIERHEVGRIHAAEGLARFEVSAGTAREILARTPPPGSPRIWRPAGEG